MSERTALADLRNSIDKINRELIAESAHGEVANADVLSKLKNSNAQDIADLTPRLIDIALVKLLNDVSGRPRKSGNNTIGDLFGYRNVPQSVPIAKGLKKDFAHLKYDELEAWVETKLAKAAKKMEGEYRDILADFAKYKRSDDDTLELALGRKYRVEHPKFL